MGPNPGQNQNSEIGSYSSQPLYLATICAYVATIAVAVAVAVGRGGLCNLPTQNIFFAVFCSNISLKLHPSCFKSFSLVKSHFPRCFSIILPGFFFSSQKHPQGICSSKKQYCSQLNKAGRPIEAGRKTNRQADRQTGRWADRQTDRRTDRQTGTKTRLRLRLKCISELADALRAT